jgi:hypothetical protein
MLRRSIASTLLLCYLAACTSWHVKQGVSPRQVISTEHPRTVRVTRTDGSRISLDEPRIVTGDSLVGVHNGVRSSVVVSDVTQVATQKFSPGKSIGLVLGLSAAVVAVAVIACLSDNSGTGACSDN